MPHEPKDSFIVLAVNVGSFRAVIGAGDEKAADSTPETKTVSPLRKLLDESLAWKNFFRERAVDDADDREGGFAMGNNTRGGAEEGMTVLISLMAVRKPPAVFIPGRGAVHGLGSLSRGTMLAKRDGVVVWHPEKPGVQFQPIPAGGAPAETPAARLRQMKSMASQFSSTLLGWRGDNSDREVLRMLPQPLYRYESKRSDLLDGAVFAFVQGTDPESLLLIEAFKKDDGFEWQFAFALRTSGVLEGRHQDKIVWHSDRLTIENDPRLTYISLTRPLNQTSPVISQRKANDHEPRGTALHGFDVTPADGMGIRG